MTPSGAGVLTLSVGTACGFPTGGCWPSTTSPQRPRRARASRASRRKMSPRLSRSGWRRCPIRSGWTFRLRGSLCPERASRRHSSSWWAYGWCFGSLASLVWPQAGHRRSAKDRFGCHHVDRLKDSRLPALAGWPHRFGERHLRPAERRDQQDLFSQLEIDGVNARTHNGARYGKDALRGRLVPLEGSSRVKTWLRRVRAPRQEGSQLDQGWPRRWGSDHSGEAASPKMRRPSARHRRQDQPPARGLWSADVRPPAQPRGKWLGGAGSGRQPPATRLACGTCCAEPPPWSRAPCGARPVAGVGIGRH